MEAFLEVRVFVEHVKRMSNHKVVLVDRLSRDSTVTGEDLNRIKDLPWLSPGRALKDWISLPCLNWNLPVKILQDVQDMLENKL